MVLVRFPNSPATELVPFRNDDIATVPANGVICAYLTAYPSSCPGFGDAANTNWPGWGTQFPGICAFRVNYYNSYLMGWAGRLFHFDGRGSLAFQRPVQPRGPQAGHGPLPGRHGSERSRRRSPARFGGPAPGTFTLYRGLPGFMARRARSMRPTSWWA